MAYWVIRQVSDGLFWSGGGWREHVRDAFVWSQFDRDVGAGKDPLRRICQAGEEWVELDDAGQPVEAMAGAGSTAIAQPSPDDEPIPYRLADTDDVQVVASTSERLGVLYTELTRMTAEVAQLERQRDEAAAKLEKRLAKVAS